MGVWREERKYPTQNHSCEGVGGERAAYKRLCNFADVPFSWWWWYDRLLMMVSSTQYLAVSLHSRQSSSRKSSSISEKRGWISCVLSPASSPSMNWTLCAGGVTKTHNLDISKTSEMIHSFKNVEVFGKRNNNARQR